MKGQLRQVIFLAMFGLLCTVFVFFVPWGNSSQPVSEQEIAEQNGTGTQEFEEWEKIWEHALTGKMLLLTDEKVKNADFLSFLSALQKEENLEIEVITSLSGDQKADLVLLPYDQLELSGKALQFSQDLKPYFLTGLSEILNQSWFIPYAIDPLVLYSLQKEEKKSDFIEAFQERTPKKPSESFLFWPHQEEVLKSQNLAFALMIGDFVKYNDYGAFEQWIEMLASPELRKTSYQLFSKIPECQNQPLFCLVKKGFVQWGIAFASDLQGEKDFVISAYPYQYEGFPVRVYGFALNEESPYRSRAEKVIAAYLRMGDDQLLLMLQKSAFSAAFAELAHSQCGERCETLQNLKVIEKSEEKVAALFADFLFKKLEEKKLKPDLYLQRASVY